MVEWGVRYRERLWPAWWVFLSTGLVVPASLLVFLPISQLAGVVAAVVLYGTIVAVLLLTAPVIEVDAELLRCGRARIPLALVRGAEAFEGREATAERGVRLDARAWLLIRGWVPDVVRITLDDPEDPTPYWLVSSRHPRELARVLDASVAPRP
jgi:hypothetical protein